MIDVQDLEARLAALDQNLASALALLEEHQTEVAVLVDKATKLVKLMDEAETHHGGLIGSVTLRAKNELRLELSKWKS